MGAQENTERVLRDLHVLFSKAKPYDSKGNNVIVNKNSVMNLLKELNDCMYQMLEEHELTEQGRERVNREIQKQGDDMIFDATRKAEDIYAASIMYTDNALEALQKLMTDTQTALDQIYEDTKARLTEESREMRSNQINLKTSLGELIDTQKYLRLIDEENARIARENGNPDAALVEGEPTYSAPEVRVNTEFLAANGMLGDVDVDAPEPSPISEELSADLDADYFAWQEEQQGEDKKEKKPGKLKGLFKKNS